MQQKSFNLRKPTATFAWVALTIGLVACAANPGTGRSRRVMSEEAEIEQGREVAAQVEQYVGRQLSISTASPLSPKEESPLLSKRASIIPAASYSPTGLPLQYHRL